MADRLYLSYWVRGYSLNHMLRHYETMLRRFPYSKLAEGASTLRVLAVSPTEPPLDESVLEPGWDVKEVLEIARDYKQADTAYELETFWDLWQFQDGAWTLRPSRVTLACHGPEFESDEGEQLRVEFGPDFPFLPQPELPNRVLMAHSNIRSLLRLVHDLDDTLPVERRQLWSETGENFAEHLQQVLQQSEES